MYGTSEQEAVVLEIWYSIDNLLSPHSHNNWWWEIDILGSIGYFMEICKQDNVTTTDESCWKLSLISILYVCIMYTLDYNDPAKHLKILVYSHTLHKCRKTLQAPFFL